MESTEYDYLAKVIIIGSSNVGKSALLFRYVEGTFNESYKATIGVDFKARTLTMQGKKMKLQIWDTAGQERYKNIVSAYYRGAVGVFVVYSITDEESFESVSKWLAEVQGHTTGPIIKILIGSKSDLDVQRAVLQTRGEEFAAQNSMQFFEVSSKTGQNVEEAFGAMANAVWDLIAGKELEAQNKPAAPAKVELGAPVQSKTGCCG